MQFQKMKRRLLFFIPSLLFITLTGFIISVNAPGDPVTSLLHDSSSPIASTIKKEQEIKIRQRLGLDLPLFYFSIHSLAEPDTLYKIFPVGEREMLQKLVRNHGNWQAVNEYYISLKNFIASIHFHASDYNSVYLKTDNNEILSWLLNVRSTEEEKLILQNLFKAGAYVKFDTSIKSDDLIKKYKTVTEKWDKVFTTKPTWKNYFPALSFTTNNQFNHWLFGDEYSKGILRGDLGTSYTTQQPVLDVLKPKIKWSFFLTLFSLFISLVIAIPLGVYTVRYPASVASKIIAAYSNFAYAAPVFWFATLLLVTLANPSFIKLFPATAAATNEETGFTKIFQTAWHLTLPLLCYCYASIALLTNTFQNALKQTLSEPYIKTAFAKGLTKRLVIYKHALPNVLLPLITLIANVFPAAISGSVIIENIFSIPGMGSEITLAIFTQNYPVLVAIVMLTGFMTLTGFLLADIFYGLADPRIRVAHEK